jgi:colanic acid/amylovoran biosynthesis glycosyltransferase
VTVAYLVNQYPLASHSFIRREILALEQLGVAVARFSVRETGERVVDEGDKAELAKTRAVLSVGAGGLLAATLKTVFTKPGAFLRALKLTWKVGRGGDRGFLRHLIYLAEACVLVPWFKQADATHVHAHFGTNSTTVAMLCRELGGPPYSFTTHGPEEFDRPAALRLREKIARAAFVVGISEFGRSQLLRWSEHTDWHKVHVVHCGVDAMFLTFEKSDPPATPRLASVGRLVPQKGQLLLVQAAAKLKAEGRNFELVLVGDGPLRSEIESLSKQLGLNGCVRITGMVSNAQVRQELLDSRAMVLPSFAEGLPVVVMESLALRRPVITTQIAGIPELVQGGVTGWLVPPGSIDALTDAMRQALSATPDRLAAMGAAGAKRVAERHDVLKEAAKLKHLFETSAKAVYSGRP